MIKIPYHEFVEQFNITKAKNFDTDYQKIEIRKKMYAFCYHIKAYSAVYKRSWQIV